MDVALNDGDDFANRMRNGHHGEQFVGPNGKQIERGEKETGFETQNDREWKPTMHLPSVANFLWVTR